MPDPQPTGSLFQEPLAPARTICAIGGGKGGTGKTFLAAGLGIALSKMGKRVILVDADLGCANLHTALGLPYPEETLSDFMKEKVKRLADVDFQCGYSFVPTTRLGAVPPPPFPHPDVQDVPASAFRS